MWFDGVVKALRTPEARGRLAHTSRGLNAWGFLHTPPKACGQRAAERRDVLQAVGRRQKAPPRLDGCAVETRAVRGRSLPEMPFGVRLAESGGLTTCRSLHTPKKPQGC